MAATVAEPAADSAASSDAPVFTEPLAKADMRSDIRIATIGNVDTGKSTLVSKRSDVE